MTTGEQPAAPPVPDARRGRAEAVDVVATGGSLPAASAGPSPRRHYHLGVLALVSVTAIWGSTFPLTKDLVARLPIADLYAARFGIAVVVLIAVRPRVLGNLSPRLWGTGALLGLLYGLALTLQTIGLAELPSSVSGFVTGSYLVMTPLIALVWLKTRVSRPTWAAVGLATVGTASFSLLSGSGGAPAGAVALTAVSALLYAVHLVALGKWSRPEEAYALSVVQILTLAVVMTVAAAPGGITLPEGAGDWIGVLYLATVAGAGTFLAQTWAQAHVPPTAAAVVIAVEPVWATAFAAVLYGEPLTWTVLVGGGCMLAAMGIVARPVPEERPCPESPVSAVN
ncbi:DMT family transporter [Herbidospora sp. NBRC 101105]|uniref:DMT family transporter n=1 Tax=Herbidospora sp. NBRC 101105 TaxID=3032195 RepID=UPI0024A5589D|nr:DMT family transporter [Herbidospora sp. NBRC 101105]GLX94439.1 permease [Herbidospora sp. NBRC 101105]